MAPERPPLPPGAYWFEDLEPGAWFSTGRITVTETHVVGFAGLSGDFFDLHRDDEFARSQGFAGRVAHGLLGLSLVDGLKNRAEVKLMAVASLSWNWNFRGPILIGDRIGADITVASMRPTSKSERGIAELSFSVRKQDDSVVQDGTTTLLMRRRG